MNDKSHWNLNQKNEEAQNLTTYHGVIIVAVCMLALGAIILLGGRKAKKTGNEPPISEGVHRPVRPVENGFNPDGFRLHEKIW